MFFLQLLYAEGYGAEVQAFEFRKLQQFVEAVAPVIEPVFALPQGNPFPFGFRQLLRFGFQGSFQRGYFLLIAPAQHVAAVVVHVVAVILDVADAARLALPAPGEGAGGAAEFFHILAAGIIVTSPQLGFQPVVKLGIPLDAQFVH